MERVKGREGRKEGGGKAETGQGLRREIEAE